MSNLQKCLIVLIFSSIFIGIILYFTEFHYSLSSESADWANFGGYIAGISTLANVIVFVLLTITIQKANDSSKEQDRIYQKNLIITQLRYNEIKSLSSELNNPSHAELGTYQHLKFYNANSSLLAFLRSQQELFPILKEEDVTKLILKISSLLVSIGNLTAECAGLDKNGIPVSEPKLIPDQFKLLMSQYLENKASLIAALEKFTINDKNTAQK